MILVYKDVKKSVLRTETTTSPIPGSEGVPILTILIPGTGQKSFFEKKKWLPFPSHSLQWLQQRNRMAGMSSYHASSSMILFTTFCT